MRDGVATGVERLPRHVPGITVLELGFTVVRTCALMMALLAANSVLSVCM